MANSNNILFVIIILIAALNHLESHSLPRNQPASPCCQQPPVFTLFSYSPCTCSPPPTIPLPIRVPVDFKFGELARKPFQILAGASHVALGTILNVGGVPAKFIGSIAVKGGQLAETLGYDLKTAGALKVSDGVGAITNFFKKIGQPVICVVEGDKIDVYQPVEKKVEKPTKVVAAKPVVKPYVPPTTTVKSPVTYQPVTYQPVEKKVEKPTKIIEKPVTKPYVPPTTTFKPVVTYPTTTTAKPIEYQTTTVKPLVTYPTTFVPYSAYDASPVTEASYPGNSLTVDEDDIEN